MSEPIITLKNITKQFPGVIALDDVSFSIFPSEVHAVLGENGAGKSTLMNILAGELQPDSGQVIFEGQAADITNPVVAQRLGISVVFQELALCPNLTVMENISLSSIATASPLAFVRRGRFRQRAEQALKALGMTNLSPKRVVGELSVAQQQLVEIAKAISLDVKVLILDEPNSALTSEETAYLFEVIRNLREQGVAIIYVSHRLEEVVQISDRITVMRDGRHIDTFPNDDNVTLDGLITRMVGRSVDHFFRREASNTALGETALTLSNISSEDLLHGISLDVSAGEVVGIAGLPDSGKDELVECIFGLRAHEGKVRIDRKPVHIGSPADAIHNGMALIPADRRGAGALLVMSVEDNTVASSLEQVNQFGFVNRRATRRIGEEYVEKLDTRIASLKQKMATLSGGNQQKVIIARGLATNPKVLVLHEPTRGIDVGAKAEIYTILQDLARAGVALLIVSSELPELISQCDRIFVLHHGKLTGEFTTETATEEAILACAMGQATHL